MEMCAYAMYQIFGACIVMANSISLIEFGLGFFNGFVCLSLRNTTYISSFARKILLSVKSSHISL